MGYVTGRLAMPSPPLAGRGEYHRTKTRGMQYLELDDVERGQPSWHTQPC